MLLWIKSFHIIAIVAWFAGLFYLPRIYVYHAETHDEVGQKRFVIMEHKLFYAIMMPSALLSIITGLWLMHAEALTLQGNLWLDLKLLCVLLLIVYQGLLWKWLGDFKKNQNKHSHVFYRFANEFPTLILIAVVILVVVRPFY